MNECFRLGKIGYKGRNRCQHFAENATLFMDVPQLNNIHISYQKSENKSIQLQSRSTKNLPNADHTTTWQGLNKSPNISFLHFLNISGAPPLSRPVSNEWYGCWWASCRWCTLTSTLVLEIGTYSRMWVTVDVGEGVCMFVGRCIWAGVYLRKHCTYAGCSSTRVHRGSSLCVFEWWWDEYGRKADDVSRILQQQQQQ